MFLNAFETGSEARAGIGRWIDYMPVITLGCRGTGITTVSSWRHRTGSERWTQTFRKPAGLLGLSDDLLFDADLNTKWERAIQKLGIDFSMLSGRAGRA